MSTQEFIWFVLALEDCMCCGFGTTWFGWCCEWEITIPFTPLIALLDTVVGNAHVSLETTSIGRGMCVLDAFEVKECRGGKEGVVFPSLFMLMTVGIPLEGKAVDNIL